jgi:hypothetical protein
MGKITLATPRESYLDRPLEDPKVKMARLEAQVREERRARRLRRLKYGSPPKVR